MSCPQTFMRRLLGRSDMWHVGKTSKTELAKLILAQDLFGLWGDELTPACTATLIGSQKWAGDEVAPVSLLVYLRDSVPAAQPLMVSRLLLPALCCLPFTLKPLQVRIMHDMCSMKSLPLPTTKQFLTFMASTSYAYHLCCIPHRSVLRCLV